jgi:hypothetical protein
MIDPASKKECACPFNGQLCIDGVRADFPKNKVGGLIQCRLWQHLAGKDPQSEKTIDNFDCSIAWLPVTTIETAQMSRQTSASVDKVANEVAIVHTKLQELGQAVAGAASNIREGIEAGSLHVLLPPPPGN